MAKFIFKIEEYNEAFKRIDEFEDGHIPGAINIPNESIGEEEIAELARILGGAEITSTVMQSAAEMKELAKRAK